MRFTCVCSNWYELQGGTVNRIYKESEALSSACRAPAVMTHGVSSFFGFFNNMIRLKTSRQTYSWLTHFWLMCAVFINKWSLKIWGHISRLSHRHLKPWYRGWSAHSRRLSHLTCLFRTFTRLSGLGPMRSGGLGPDQTEPRFGFCLV